MNEINVNTVITIIAGTKYPVILSAKAWMGTFDPWQASTRLMICAKNVSFPVFVTSTFNNPCLLMVAPITGSPVLLLTGIDSPVASDSSIKDSPSMTLPSEGIFSPGLMIITSPTDNSDVKTSISCPSTKILAVFAPNSISFFIANDAFPLALDSRNFPIR